MANEPFTAASGGTDAFVPMPKVYTVTIDGITIRHDNGNWFFVQNGKLVPTTGLELEKLDAERFGGQLSERVQKAVLGGSFPKEYLIYGGAALLLLLLLRG